MGHNEPSLWDRFVRRSKHEHMHCFCLHKHETFNVNSLLRKHYLHPWKLQLLVLTIKKPFYANGEKPLKNP